MRYDINILWIEDAEDWQKEAQELFLGRCEDGLLIKITHIKKDIEILFNKIQTEANGYKLYDIMFIDYNIGEGYTGDKIIDEFRKKDIDADILFYSESLSEESKKETISSAKVNFDGIYLASRSDFQAQANKLYRKNAKKLTSILNIRGFLADKTSENDYIMNSYLLEEYDKLSDSNKTIISKQINSSLLKRLEEGSEILKKGEKLSKQANHKIKEIMKLSSFLFPIESKYQIFFEMLKLRGNTSFGPEQIDKYLNIIIKKRNMVAHKKIDICKQQKFLIYFDTIKQFNERKCPDDCTQHNNDNKISLEEWKIILKKTNEYSLLFNKILEELS